LRCSSGCGLDITGGSMELDPNFVEFIELFDEMAWSSRTASR
jgi:hypothetical protein